MAAIVELRDAFEKRFATRLRDAAVSPEDAVSLRPDRWVDLFNDTFRELGKARGARIHSNRRSILMNSPRTCKVGRHATDRENLTAHVQGWCGHARFVSRRAPAMDR